MARPTLNDIARQVGYSKNTVSLALRGDRQIPEETRERIRKAAARLGYQPNAVVSHLIAQLRAGRTARFQAKLALINAHRDPKAFRTHATIPAYVAGCERRGLQLGYTFDHFWLHDPKLKAESLIRILRTRGIKGIILVGLMDHNQLPAPLQSVWPEFPCVVTGVRTRDPALSFSCVDHHDLVIQAFERARRVGDMGRVIIDEIGGEPADVVDAGEAALQFQAALDQLAGAGADHIARGLERDRRQALPVEDIVERVDQVGRRIHERAVKIEHNNAG